MSCAELGISGCRREIVLYELAAKDSEIGLRLVFSVPVYVQPSVVDPSADSQAAAQEGHSPVPVAKGLEVKVQHSCNIKKTALEEQILDLCG